MCVWGTERERERMCVWAVDLHGFYLEAEGEKVGKSLHIYANQCDEITMGVTGCGRSFMITCFAQKPTSHTQRHRRNFITLNTKSSL